MESLLNFGRQFHQLSKLTFAAKSPHDKQRGHNLKVAEFHKEINCNNIPFLSLEQVSNTKEKNI